MTCYSKPGAPPKLPYCHQGDHSPQVWMLENPCSFERVIQSPLQRGFGSSWILLIILIQESIICWCDGSNASPFYNDPLILYDYLFITFRVILHGLRVEGWFGWQSLEVGWERPQCPSSQCHVPHHDLVGWSWQSLSTLTSEGNPPLRNWILLPWTGSP